MTRAAEALAVTPGAISRQVRLLEEDLGVALFTGPKRSPRLTPAGEALAASLQRAFRLIDDAVAGARQHPHSRLAVSSLGTFMMRWLIPRLHRFEAGRPDIAVTLTQSDAAVDFDRDGVDLAIRIGRPPWPERMQVRSLVAERIGVVVAPRLLAGVEPIAPTETHRWTRLRTRTRPSAWRDWAAATGLDRFDDPDGPLFEHFYFLLEAAGAGLGAAIAPEALVGDDLAAGRLIAPFGFVASGQAFVVQLPSHPTPAATAFADWLAMEA